MTNPCFRPSMNCLFCSAAKTNETRRARSARRSHINEPPKDRNTNYAGDQPRRLYRKGDKWPTLELHRRVRSRSYLTNQQREHGKGSREIYPNKVRRNGPDRGYCHRSRARINPVPLALTRLLPPLLSNFRFFLGFRLQRENTEVNQRQRNRDKRVFQSQNSKTGKLKLWNAALIAGVS